MNQNSMNKNEIDNLLPANLAEYSESDQILVRGYIDSFDETQRKAYLLAREHLGTSFHITRSNGFKSWAKIK